MSGIWWWLRTRSHGHRVCHAMYNALQTLTGSAISWNARLSTCPCLPHGPKGIFISGGATIGQDCVIFQHVTIGSNTLIDSNSQGAPAIGNRCYLGAGSKIVGGIVIGDNVRIGANVVVYRDVPDNSIVTNGEMIVRHRENTMDNRYYNYPGKWMCWENGKFHEVQDDRLIALARIKIAHKESLTGSQKAGTVAPENITPDSDRDSRL